jgi:hypothetical protein
MERFRQMISMEAQINDSEMRGGATRRMITPMRCAKAVLLPYLSRTYPVP